ncbi:MAG TPA: DUF427 domain-containing protein [Kofleriaceae bacterium]|nr:DUF427 domain-containing protein [Kofleriaceae bacterium]
MRVEPVAHVRVQLDGKTIAETAHGYVVHELGLPDRYYLPRGDVRGQIAEGEGQGVCPWKGKWKHVDVELDGRRVHNLAWTYYEPTPLCEPLRDKIAFYESKVAISHA